jgi:DNA-binding SARP family transcriptional activator/tetratricopeptide (TPR) repeat protein
VEIRVLGPLEVVVDGAPVALPGHKTRLLLAALVVYAGEVVSTDRLYEILWGARPPASAGNTLQTYIAQLRKALEPGRPRGEAGRVLVTREPGYLLELEPEELDAGRFERLARSGRNALHDAPGEAAATLRAALSLWRGDPFAHVTYEPFAQADIARLTEMRLTAIEDRVDADLAVGAHATVCGELVELVAEHPLHERLWGQLMTALYRCGRQADALDAYRRVRAQLVEQLGIEPSPALRELHAAILQQRSELEWPPRRNGPAPVSATEPPAAAATGADDSQGSNIEAARAALRRRDWPRAFEHFSAADAEGQLGGEELDGFADAALFTGHVHESLAARARAHAAFVTERATGRAAAAAIVLCIHHAARLQLAVADGWFQRARRLLEDEGDCIEQGYLSWAAMMFAIAGGDDEDGLAAARETYEAGRRFGIPDLEALGLTFQGYILVHQGRVKEGMKLIDEGMTWAVAGDVAPLPSAIIFCRTIGTCYELGDYRRAGEWMQAVDDCFARTGIAAFPGDCEAHRLGIQIGRGAWSECELDARRACGELEASELTHVGLVFAEIGEIRLRTGDLEGAELAFSQSAAYGHRPQPGLALLHLARGDLETAAGAIAAALADEAWDRLARSRLLPAQVEIALANDDHAVARAAAAELGELAAIFGSSALTAASEQAQGALLLADGDAVAAAAALRRAVRLWGEAGAPYDAAKARLILGRALVHTGERGPALAELDAARESLHRLGARLEHERAVRAMQDLRTPVATP